MIYQPLPKEQQELVHITPEGVLTLDKSKNETFLEKVIRKLKNFFRITSPTGKLIRIDDHQNPIACDRMIREQGEVIAPMPYDTVEDIASLMSCAACDHEYSRVIVYPISPEMRTKVLDLIEKDTVNYPMYEYRPAGLVSNDDLNSQTIIYKYYGKTHYTKPV